MALGMSLWGFQQYYGDGNEHLLSIGIFKISHTLAHMIGVCYVGENTHKVKKGD